MGKALTKFVKKVSQKKPFLSSGLAPVLHLVQFIRPDFTEFSSKPKFSAELKSFSHN